MQGIPESQEASTFSGRVRGWKEEKEMDLERPRMGSGCFLERKVQISRNSSRISKLPEISSFSEVKQSPGRSPPVPELNKILPSFVIAKEF